MPDLLTLEDFQPYLNQTFTIRLEGIDPIPLELVNVAPLTESGRGPSGRQPFSLLFLGPVSQQYLLQHTYCLEHIQFGEHDLFLVPLGSEAGRMRYEAIFA
jgi:hypothetical protein